MTRDFPPVLARLIPRLGSPFDHEVVATARGIERTLKSQKLDWHDVAEAVTAPPTQWDYEPHRTESGEARQMRAWLTAISCEDWLNEWTAGFVSDLLLRPSPSRPCRIEVRISARDGPVPIGRSRPLKLTEPDIERLIDIGLRLEGRRA